MPPPTSGKAICHGVKIVARSNYGVLTRLFREDDGKKIGRGSKKLQTPVFSLRSWRH